MKLKHQLSYYYLAFLIFVLPLIPKEFGTILNIIPTRLALISFWFVIVFYELFTKKIKFNNIRINLFIVLYSIFIFTMFFSFFHAIDNILFFYTVSKYICYGIFIVLLIKYPFDKKQLNFLTNLLLYSGLIAILYSFAQYIFDINLTTNGIYKYPGAIGRVDANFYNPNYFAIFLLGIIILCFYKITTSTLLKERVMYLIEIFLSIIAIFLTFTRSVYLLLIIVLISTFILSLFKQNKKYFLFCISPILFLICLLYVIPGAKYVYSSSLIQLLPNNYSINFVKFTNKFLFANIDLDLYLVEDKKEGTKYKIIDDASLNSRNSFKKIIKRVIEDYPLTGVGMGNYEKFVLANKDKYIFNDEIFGYPHNSLLHLQVEAGSICIFIFGVILVGAILWFFIKRIIIKKVGYIFLFILWSSLLVLTQFESFFYDTQLFPLLLIVTAFIIKSLKKDESNEQNVMFISSVGGHLTQLLQLSKKFHNYDYILVTEKTDVTKDLNKKYCTEFLLHGSRHYPFSYIFIFLFNIIKSFYLFIKYDPQVIVTTGTHTAVPMCYIGWLFGRKIIFIESFAKRISPTLSGRLVYPIATVFVVQWESMLKYYPKAKFWGWIY